MRTRFYSIANIPDGYEFVKGGFGGFCGVGAVSKGFMRVARRVARGVAYFGVVCAGLLAMMWIGGLIGQHVFRRRVERLLAAVRATELRKTSWEEAQARFSEWKRWTTYGSTCDSRQCSFEIVLAEPVFTFVGQSCEWLDNYLRWRLERHYGDGDGPFVRSEIRILQSYLRMGGHPGRVTVSLEMRDGKVSGESVFVSVETYGHPIGWSGDFRQEFSLSAWFYAADRLPTNHDLGFKPEHPDFEIIWHPCTVCVLGTVIFTPEAEGADVRRLTQIKTSCFTKWRPCLTQADIMPAAWRQFMAENGGRPF